MSRETASKQFTPRYRPTRPHARQFAFPKVSGDDLVVHIEFAVRMKVDAAKGLDSDLRQILDDLGLDGQVQVEQKE